MWHLSRGVNFSKIHRKTTTLYKCGSNEGTTVVLMKTEKDGRSSTKKSLCVNGVSQSWTGRKQAERAILLETWTLSSEIGRMTQRMQPGAQGQSREPLRTIFREQNSFLIKLLMTCTKQISQPLWPCWVPSV